MRCRGEKEADDRGETKETEERSDEDEDDDELPPGT